MGPHLSVVVRPFFLSKSEPLGKCNSRSLKLIMCTDVSEMGL